ncbi:MAG: cytochrome c3 family protein, partial [Candidatus Eiseniibacteriota bacterium]
MRVMRTGSRSAWLALWLIVATAQAAAAAPAPLPGSDDCLMCHQAGPPIAHRAADEAPHFDADGLRDSPHAGLECAACHADLKGVEFPHAAPLKPVECGACHAKEAAEYAASVHGAAASRGLSVAPDCKRCHGTHAIRRPSDVRSATYARNVPALCGQCHLPGVPRRFASTTPRDTTMFAHYDSIHGPGIVMKGLVSAAVCTSCHTAHQVLPQSDARSSVARQHVVGTCM